MLGLVDEEDIIKHIIVIEQFNRYYYSRFLIKDIQLEWIVNPELDDYYAMYSEDVSGIDEIFLRNQPKSYIDAFLVAHEIEHAIRKIENQSLQLISINEVHKNLAGYLSSVFEDSIVDSFLKNKYGFNLLPHYGRDLVDCLKTLTNPLDTITTDLGRTMRAFIYANQLLRWELINDEKYLKLWKRYQNFFGKKHKDIAGISTKLYTVVKESNIQETETGLIYKKKQLFNQISKMCIIDGQHINELIYIK